MISILYGAFLLGLTGLLILQSPAAAQAALEGLRLCGKQLIPALFPFFVVSNLLMGQEGASALAVPLKPITRLLGLKSKQAPLILLLSWCGGYGVCARVIREALERKQLTRRDAQLLLLLGTTSSPGFAIGAVGGGLLGNLTLGLYFYLACLAGNFVCGVLWSLFLPSDKTTGPEISFHNSTTLSQSIQSAVQACLTVCGCVVFFRVLSALCILLVGLDGVSGAFLSGLLEVSSGCAALAALGGKIGVYGCCGALSLLSGSVFLQMGSLLAGSCSLRCLMYSRPVHLAVSLAVLDFLLRVHPQTAPVYSSLAPQLILTSRTAPDTALLIFGMCCVVLRLLQQKNRPQADGSSD